MSIKQYINETRAEMRHVTWPTRKQAITYSLIVIVVSIALALYLAFFDSLFTSGIKLLIPGL